MKFARIDQNNNAEATRELKLQPSDALSKTRLKAETYDGGFHIQSSVTNSKRVVSKRSAFQEFTCR